MLQTNEKIEIIKIVSVKKQNNKHIKNNWMEV
jgi:hypothetical protein